MKCWAEFFNQDKIPIDGDEGILKLDSSYSIENMITIAKGHAILKSNTTKISYIIIHKSNSYLRVNPITKLIEI